MRFRVPLFAILLTMTACADQPPSSIEEEGKPEPSLCPDGSRRCANNTCAPEDELCDFEDWEADNEYGSWRVNLVGGPGVCGGTYDQGSDGTIDASWTVTASANMIETQWDSDADGTFEVHQLAELNADGQPHAYTSGYNIEGVGNITWTFSYDDKGRRSRIDVTTNPGGLFAGTMVWSYDANRSSMDAVGSDGLLDEHRNYVFDEEGRKVRLELDLASPAQPIDGVFEFINDYSWDERGLSELRQAYSYVEGSGDHINGTWIHRQLYDDAGHHTGFDRLDTSGLVQSTLRKTYDDQGRLIRREETFTAPGSQGNYAYEYKYDCL